MFPLDTAHADAQKTDTAKSFPLHFPIAQKGEEKNKQLCHINSCYTDSWGFIAAPSVVLLTHTGREGLVPHSPVPAEAGQGAAAMEAVSRVAGVQDKGVGVVAVVLDLVAVVGNSRLLAANQVKTYSRELRETNVCADLALPAGVTGGQWWVKGLGGRGVTSRRRAEAHLRSFI